ncbi:uncharacterized protein YukE [Nocardia sp. GAS34]|uniref:WXG100 family type VII secretion target n=1 Tax=unclassified Nocardia TaxID=2637762 RepID=UPI003D22A2ED
MSSPMTRYDGAGMEDYHATLTGHVGELHSCLDGIHGAHQELQGVWSGEGLDACTAAVAHLKKVVHEATGSMSGAVNAAQQAHVNFVEKDTSVGRSFDGII